MPGRKRRVSVGEREAELQRERERLRESNFLDRIFGGGSEPPRQPPRPPTPSGNGPEYNPDDDSWSGTGAPTNREWSQLKRDAYRVLEHTASGRERRDSPLTGEPSEDLRHVIDAIEGGFSVSEVREFVREQRRAVDDWANGDTSRGRAHMARVIELGLPIELGYYHWMK